MPSPNPGGPDEGRYNVPGSELHYKRQFKKQAKKGAKRQKRRTGRFLYPDDVKRT